MMWIGLGALAFGILTLFDLHKIKPIHPVFNLSFALGCLLLATSTGVLLFTRPMGFSFPAMPWFWVLAIVG
ncbi:MAG: hypothetical protein JXK92_01660, partial [Erysipelotrichaceae bacterium]|nr:hypothetical protein [Erysipelotrichaceae bacterium]